MSEYISNNDGLKVRVAKIIAQKVGYVDSTFFLALGYSSLLDGDYKGAFAANAVTLFSLLAPLYFLESKMKKEDRSLFPTDFINDLEKKISEYIWKDIK